MFKFKMEREPGKERYKERMDELILEMGRLQREAKERRVPVLIILEGLDASGKGAVMSELLMSLDPRGYNVYSNNREDGEETLRPLFWRFWNHLPGQGEITIFDRSWYYSVVNEGMKGKEYRRRCREIRYTEELLQKDGTLILKFFLYTSRKEQKKRFEALSENPSTSWKVTKKDWKSNKNYEEILKNYERIIEDTQKEELPWNLVFSEDFKYARLRVMEGVVEGLRRFLEGEETEVSESIPKAKNSFTLDDVNLSVVVEKDEYKKKLRRYQERLLELEHEIYERRIPVIIAYEGWDAAGKGGNIKRLVERMDPRGYDVIPVAAPTDTEKSHHYLWRFWKYLPKGGHISIFDRTWYGRVLVERIEGFCTENQWKRAYKEIDRMEKQWVDDGAVVLKFWIHIDPHEQLRRFKEREATEYKRWKITEEDWRNRERWSEYREAVEDMVRYTSSRKAPWYVIGGNSKYNARLQVMERVIEAVEKRLDQKS